MAVWVISPFLAIVPSAALNFYTSLLCGHMFAFLLGRYVVFELLGHFVNITV